MEVEAIDATIAAAREASAADAAALAAEGERARAVEDAAALGIVGVTGTVYRELAYTQNTYTGRPIGITEGPIGSADGMFSSRFGFGE